MLYFFSCSSNFKVIYLKRCGAVRKYFCRNFSLLYCQFNFRASYSVEKKFEVEKNASYGQNIISGTSLPPGPPRPLGSLRHCPRTRPLAGGRRRNAPTPGQTGRPVRRPGHRGTGRGRRPREPVGSWQWSKQGSGEKTDGRKMCFVFFNQVVI